jgi:hypothetical protein
MYAKEQTLILQTFQILFSFSVRGYFLQNP